MKYNMQRIDKDIEEAKSRQSGNYINLKDGETVTGRFLPVEKPSADGESELYVRYSQHYLKSAQRYLTCLREPVVSDYVEDDCPVCEQADALMRSRDEEDQKMARNYRSSVKFLSNFKVAGDDPRVAIFRYTNKSLQSIVKILFDNQDYPGCADIKDGRDIKIRRSGDGLDTEYSFLPMPKTYSIEKSILDRLPDLYSEIRVLPAKKMRAVLRGAEPADDDFVTLRSLMGDREVSDDDGESRRAKGKKADEDEYDEPRRPKSRMAEVDEDDDDDGEPRRAKGKKAADEDDESPREKRGKAGRNVVTMPKAERKVVLGFAEELDIAGIDFDEWSRDDVVAGIITEAEGMKVSKLSAELVTWLSEQGCNVDGKLVVAPKKSTKTAKAAPDDDGDDDDDSGGSERARVEREIEALRSARARAGSRR